MVACHEGLKGNSLRNSLTLRILQIFEYLRAAKSLSTPIIKDVADYGELLWWEVDLPLAEGYLR